MSTTVELGQLVLSYPKAELQLGLVASTTTTLSQDSVNLQQSSSEYVSNLLTSKSAWVCRGSGLHLVTQVKIDGQPLGIVESEILSRSLTNADLWSQLYLHASLPTDHLDTAHSSYKSGIVQLKLSHTRTDPDVEKKRSHRLSFDVPFADVKPPDGVPVCALRAVCLSIEISRAKQPPKSKKARCPIEHENKGEGKGNKIAFLQDGWYLRGLEEPFQTCSWPGDMILLSGRSDPTKATFIQLDDKEVPNFTPDDLTRTSCLRKRSAESALHEVDSTVDSTVEQHSELNFDQIMELLDAAVRMTICRNPLKISSGVKVKASSFSARLAEIAPSLWSPDYLPAVSQRACLTPIISRALCHSILKTRSFSLKCKMEELAARGLRQSNIRPDIPSNAPRTFKNVHIMNQLLAARLWSFIQSTLFDPFAARRLKPLWQPGARVSDTIGSDEILEEQNTQGLEGGSEPHFQSGDALESVDDYADNDSDGELLMASVEDAWIPDIGMRRHGDLKVDFDCVHAGGLSQNKGLAAGTLQHSNVDNELGVSFLESTYLGGLEGRAITNDDYGDVNECFEPLNDVIVCSPFDSGLFELDKRKGEDLSLEERVAKSQPPQCQYLMQGSAEPTLRLGERFHDNAESEDLILRV